MWGQVAAAASKWPMGPWKAARRLEIHRTAGRRDIAQSGHGVMACQTIITNSPSPAIPIRHGQRGPLAITGLAWSGSWRDHPWSM